MISISHLQKHYPGFSLDASFDVPAGAITGLIGRNGAGKSTTFKALLGLIRPDGGDVTILGKPLDEMAPEDRRDIGVVLADSTFYNQLTINDIKKILAGFYPSFDSDFFSRQAAAFALPPKKKIKEFSTGMLAKLKVLTAVSHDAKLLILDEPTAGLDVLARDDVLDMLRAFMEADDERAILISSHISSDLEQLCDDLYMIHDGRIVFHEDTDVLLANYALLKLTDSQFAAIDRHHLLRVEKTSFGVQCLTNEKRFYHENYPDISLENAGIDDVFAMMIRGDQL